MNGAFTGFNPGSKILSPYDHDGRYNLIVTMRRSRSASSFLIAQQFTLLPSALKNYGIQNCKNIFVKLTSNLFSLRRNVFRLFSD